MRKLFLYVVLVFSSSLILGQDDPVASSYSTQLLPNNPDAANLGKFGNIPINEYNGTANISVPIYSVDFEGLSIPIVARYNTSGIRAEQEASWIGLGWNLNEGYSISREIQGFDDLNSQINGVTNEGWIYTDTYLEFNSEGYSYGGSPIVIHPDKFAPLAVSFRENKAIDTEPDLYTINLPNSSVSFYLPKIQGGEAELIGKVINEKNFKVFYHIGNKTFRVIDPLGFEYSFNVIERSSSFSNWETPQATNEADALIGIPVWYNIFQTSGIIMNWKLDKITSPLGKELTFGYEDGLYCSYPRFSETSIHSTFQGNVAMPQVGASINLFYSKYLSNIQGDFGSVEFVKSNRLDLSSMESFSALKGYTWQPELNRQTNIKKLDAVVVKDFHGNQVHRADFSYSYFNEDEQNNAGVTNKEKYLRLKLDAIDINDQNYNFEYFSSNDLPAKDTKSKDFWGFYNGIANTLRVPSSNRYYKGANPSYPMGSIYFSRSIGANRKSDINFGKIGSMKKVTYPTKGSSEFIYEGNTVSLKKPFHTRTMNSNGSVGNISVGSSASYNFRYQYLKLANDSNYSFYNSTYTTTAPNIYEEFEVGGNRIQKVIYKDTNGDYIKASEYNYDAEQPNNTVSSSGKLMDDLIFTSAGMGNYEYTPERFEPDTSNPYQSPIGAYLHSDNRLRTKNSASGSHVGYSKVTSRDVNLAGQDLGKVTSNFKNTENEYLQRASQSSYQIIGNYGNTPGVSSPAYYEMIFTNTWSNYYIGEHLQCPETYILGGAVKTFEHENGAVQLSQVYSKTDELLHETENEYINLSMSTAFSYYPKIVFFGRASSLFHPFEKVYSTNDLKNNKLLKPKKTIKRDFLNGKTVTTTSEYKYDSGNHNYVTEVTTTDSRNEVIKKKSYYPQDVNNTTLIAKNQLAIPLKNEVYIDNVLQSTQNSIYKNFSGDYLPERLQASKATRPIEDRLIYHSYDDGNPKELSKKNGSKVYYVWGYNKTQPIAKIEGYENISASQQTAINNAITASNNDKDAYTENLLRARLILLRNSFSSSTAQVTTQTYNPLIGTTSVTDPRGRTTYYSYDSNNRLEYVKDAEGNILSKTAYNYKN